jgi:hypothetical protein
MSFTTSRHDPRQKPGRSRVVWIGLPPGGQLEQQRLRRLAESGMPVQPEQRLDPHLDRRSARIVIVDGVGCPCRAGELRRRQPVELLLGGFQSSRARRASCSLPGSSASSRRVSSGPSQSSRSASSASSDRLAIPAKRARRSRLRWPLTSGTRSSPSLRMRSTGRRGSPADRARDRGRATAVIAPSRVSSRASTRRPRPPSAAWCALHPVASQR